MLWSKETSFPAENRILTIQCKLICLGSNKGQIKIKFICCIPLLHKEKTPWPGSASELYRPSYSRLSAKLVPSFVDRRVPRGQRNGPLRPYSRISRPEPLLFLPSRSSIVLTRLWAPNLAQIMFNEVLWRCYSHFYFAFGGPWFNMK
jgi:hypothetical protein